MFSDYVAPVLALLVLGVGAVWFCEQRAKRFLRDNKPEDKTMDHQQLHTLMLCASDVRLTSAQAGELVAEFNRIKASLNDAMDRNASMHIELEQVKRVANDEARKSAELERKLLTAAADTLDAEAEMILTATDSGVNWSVGARRLFAEIGSMMKARAAIARSKAGE